MAGFNRGLSVTGGFFTGRVLSFDFLEFDRGRDALVIDTVGDGANSTASVISGSTALTILAGTGFTVGADTVVAVIVWPGEDPAGARDTAIPRCKSGCGAALGL